MGRFLQRPAQLQTIHNFQSPILNLKFPTMKKILSSLALAAALALALTLPASAATDAALSVSQTNCSSLASNSTASFDLLSATPDTAWRNVYILADIPALTNSVIAATNMLFMLQDSANNVAFTNTVPQVIARVPGVATTGSLATKIKMPIPPGVRRYVKIAQIAGAYDPGTTVSTNWYYLVVP
jgi:hypothetical protein